MNPERMPQTVENLESQKSALYKRLEETPMTIGGAYNRKYYSLKAKIKNLQKSIDDLKLFQWLAQ